LPVIGLNIVCGIRYSFAIGPVIPTVTLNVHSLSEKMFLQRWEAKLQVAVQRVW